jgi:autotransporter-associated beta strand protein
VLSAFAFGLAAMALQLTEASAACAPATGSNITVTCGGATVNQGPGINTGYGDSTQNGLTLNVQSGASVLGTSTGIDVNNNNTINNLGTISTNGSGGIGNVYGINANGPLTLNNSGTIGRVDLGNSANTDAAGVNELGGLVLTNNSGGVIQGSIAVLAAGTPNTMTVTNSGLISGIVGGGGMGISGDSMTVTNNASGTITGDAFGINANTATVVNYGTISAPSFGGVGVNVNTLTLTNYASGVITGDAAAISGSFTPNLTITNFGTISGGIDAGIGGAISGNVVNVTNSGTISSATGSGGPAISMVSGSVINNTGGSITGDYEAIATNGHTSVFNAGTISANSGPAIYFQALGSGGSGGNTLTLGPGSVINGAVLGAGSDTFQLGGTGTGSFNLSTIGTQYTGFATFSVVGATWIAAGTGSQNWSIASGATLQLGNGNSSGAINGNIADNGTFAIDRSDTYTFAGTISGSGSFVQTGSGTTVLTGTSSYTGATNVNAGTLQAGGANVFAPASAFTIAPGATLALNSFNQSIASLAGAGNVTLGSATLTLSNAAGAFSGIMSGVGGSLVQTAGTETLTGANTFTGGTTLNGGKLVVGNNSALGTGTLAMAPGTTLSFLGTGNFTIANKITISGDPNFAPPAGTTQTISGVIANGGSPGTLTMNGAGTLVLSAIETYTGPTTVTSGTLDVTGSIASSSSVTVANGATLTGSGTIGSEMVTPGSTFQPGTAGAPGTSSKISGNLAFQSGAIYLVQVNPTAASYATVSGTATLTGGIVNVQFASGSYTVSKEYTILTASGGLGGTTFAGLTNTNQPSNVGDTLVYDANDVYLKVTPSFGAFTGLNINQQNVANTLINYFNSTGGIPATFFNLTANGLTQIDGEVAADAEFGAFQLTTQFLNLMLDPFVDGRLGSGGGQALGFAPDVRASLPPDVTLAYASILKAPPQPTFDQRWTAWGSAYGGANSTNGSTPVGSSNVTAQTFGFAGGMDYHVTRDTIFGFALGGGGIGWGLASGNGSGRSDAFQAGVYGITRAGPAYIDAALAFANHWMTTNRSALGDQLTADFSAQSYGVRVESGYRYAVLPTLGVTPYAAVQAQDFHTPNYSESDVTGGGLGLSYASMNATDVRTELGSRFDAPTVVAGMPLILRGRLAWAHDFVNNPSLSAAFESLPGTSFVVNGAPMRQNSALTSAGTELFITSHLTLLTKFDGEFANGSQTYGGSGTLRYSW